MFSIKSKGINVLTTLKSCKSFFVGSMRYGAKRLYNLRVRMPCDLHMPAEFYFRSELRPQLIAARKMT